MGLATLVLGAAVLYACWPALICMECRKLETPKYTVQKILAPAVEIRKYDSFVVASTKVSGPMRASMSDGFRSVAGYIFGKNKAKQGGDSQKISMTAPVRYERGSGGRGEVSFVMPSAYKKATLPRPVSDQVKIKEVPVQTFAVLRFSGPSPTDEQLRERTKQLEGILKEQGYESAGAVQLHQYHPPFAPSWLRRNEVLLPIRKEGFRIPLIWENAV